MAVKSAETTSHSVLEERLRDDIRQRGLQPGDRYLTTEEAAELLNVSLTTASRVMRRLANRQVLERRRRLGTLIGPHAPVTSKTRMSLVQIFMVHDLEAEYATQELVGGFHQILPKASVQLNFMPETDAVGYVEDVIRSTVSQDRLMGIIAISVPRDVHRYLQESNLPVVVLGSVFPEVEALPSVDLDNHRVGELIVEYALAQHKKPRIAFLPLTTWTAGDNAVLQGMTRALSKASLPADSLIVRSVPEELADEEIRRLIGDGDHPTVVFCRKRLFAEAAMAIAKEYGLRPGKDIHVIGDAYPAVQGFNLPYPYVIGESSYRESVVQATKMLQAQFNREALTDKHVLMPVKMCGADQA